MKWIGISFWGIFILVFTLDLIIETDGDRARKEQREAERDPIELVRYACVMAIENELHDPRSAEMVDIETWTVHSLDGDKFMVYPRVRAKNGFGAKVLANWGCTMRYEPGGFRLLELEQLA